MSPVATRVESWLKPAQVTESLWPARKSGQKEKKVSGYLVLETHDPVIWPLERTRGEKDRQTNPRIGTPMRCCFRNQHPRSPQGFNAGVPLNHSHAAQAYVFPILSTPHLCLKYPHPPVCPNTAVPGLPPLRPFLGSLGRLVPPCAQDRPCCYLAFRPA